MDIAYKIVNSKLNQHDAMIGQVSKTMGELNENLEMLELAGGGDLHAATMWSLEQMENQHNLLLKRLDKDEKDSREREAASPRVLPAVGGGVDGTSYGFRQFSRRPQGLIMKVFEKIA